MKTFDHILMPTDFGAPSAEAVELAVSLATALKAQLTLLHVWDLPTRPYMDVVVDSRTLHALVEKAAAERLQRALEHVRQRIPGAQSALRMGEPWEEILEAVSTLRPSLLIMGTHGRRGVSRALLGSVTEKLIRLSPVPVLTIRGSEPL
jgi:nucleotide-binding universal stress UspA family protein